MRNLTLVCAGLAAVAGIVSVNLWLELRSERQISAQLRAQPAPQAEPQPTPSPAPAAAQPEPAQPPPAEAPAAGASPAITALPTPAIRAVNITEMLTDPEVNKTMLAQLRSMVPQQFPGLVEELGLTQEEADQLFNLLAEGGLSMTAATLSAGGGQADAAAMQEAARARQEAERKQEVAIASQLGASRYGQWREYQQTRTTRIQSVQVSRNMEVLGQPLSAAQSRHLTQAFIAEHQRQREETHGQNPGSAVGDPVLAQTQTREESLRRQAERNRRVSEAVASQLTAQQLETLRTTLERELSSGQANARMILLQFPAQRESSGEPSVGEQ
jgi:hypothetical protein